MVSSQGHVHIIVREGMIVPDPEHAGPPLCLEKRFATFSRHSIRAVHGRGCVRSFVKDGGVCDANEAEALAASRSSQEGCARVL